MTIIGHKFHTLIRLVVILTACLIINITSAFSQGATVKEYRKTFVTYPYSDPNPIPEYTRYYPYFRFDGYTTKPEQKEWKVIELENPYIRVMILPEIGGKIWTAVEKVGNRPFIYYNHVVKFRDVAMRGPWTSGGIESNYGIFGHTPNCATPVDYLTRNNEDGSVSCFIGVLDMLTRTRWTIEINLPADKAYFSTRSYWHNDSPLGEPYYHWMNVGIKATDGLQFIFPGNKWIGHIGEVGDWPVNKENQKHIDWYRNNDFGGYHSYHVMGIYTDFWGAYWHDEGLGIVRYSPREEKIGKKIWIWGLSREGMIWEDLLTDHDGQYVEIQSGRLFNQAAENSTYSPFKHEAFEPYATDRWEEYWYPVMNTEGFVKANEYGALNYSINRGRMNVYFAAVQNIDDTLKVMSADSLVYAQKISLKPLQSFRDSMLFTHPIDDIKLVLGNHKIEYDSREASATLHRPYVMPSDYDWSSSYGLYIQGNEYLKQRKYEQAETQIDEALVKDKNLLPALVLKAELLYRKIQYKDALLVAKKALSVDTYDPEANYIYGLINRVLGNEYDARDGFEVAGLSPAYRSAAYTELAKLELAKKDYSQAIYHAGKSLENDINNITALELQAIALRYSGRLTEAKEIIEKILEISPLDHLAWSEAYFLDTSGTKRHVITSHITNELPDQSILEMALFYLNIGCQNECDELLTFIPDNPISGYISAWLSKENGNEYLSKLITANSLPVGFTFTYRPELQQILSWSSENSESWKPKYLLALLYGSKGRLNLCRQYLFECEDRPDYAPFYAFRFEMNKDTLPRQAVADLMTAMNMDGKEWRYPKMLIDYYTSHNELESALKYARTFHKVSPENYIMGLQYVKVLLLNKDYTVANKELESLNLIPFEGAVESRELYRETKLMLALDALKKGKYKNAIELIQQSRLWPEHLGVGKPYKDDIDDRLENYLESIIEDHLGQKDASVSLMRKIIDFKPGTYFYESNNLIQLWALEATGRKQETDKFIENWTETSTQPKLINALLKLFKCNVDGVSELEMTNANQRLIKWIFLELE